MIPLDPGRPPFLVHHLYRSRRGAGLERNPTHVQPPLVRIGLKVDLDPSGEVLAVDLEGIPGPSPASEPGDFPSRQPGEPQHDGEHGGEFVAVPLKCGVENPMGDVAIRL